MTQFGSTDFVGWGLKAQDVSSYALHAYSTGNSSSALGWPGSIEVSALISSTSWELRCATTPANRCLVLKSNTLFQTAGQVSSGTCQTTLDGRQRTPFFSVIMLKTKTNRATSKWMLRVKIVL
ncbi:MAG TPA: hypothetical protein DD473_09415 [Planctomycetaceae bacterium]|nr:hypothetical protein [Planctomycetaceae bacterium]